ncbi:MAG: hypothetical protein ABEJ35_03835 [Halobacteriaceae archaeon]
MSPSAGLWSPAVATVPEFPSPLALVGTAVLYWTVYAYAAQVAATFMLGDPPWRKAGAVGIVFAAVNLALIRFAPAVVLPIALLADFAAFRLVYRVRYATVALLTLLHAAVSVAFTVVGAYVLTLLSTAPA